MKEIWVTQASIVTALGNDLDEIWSNLLAGKSGIRQICRFNTENYVSDYAALIEDLETSSDKSLIYSLLDRLLMGFGPVPEDAFLITASTKAGIDSLEKICRREVADQSVKDVWNFIQLESLFPSEILASIARHFNLGRAGINISAACASSTIAIARGASLIASGFFDVVLICCFDLVTEFVHAGFSALKALSPEPCQPFDRQRKGLTLGEGGALILLMSKERAQKENLPCLGKITGWGTGSDAYHLTAPIPDGTGLVKGVRQALQKAGISSEDIGAVNAHGTGTIYNDQMELAAFKRIFGFKKIPVHSVKGALGHTLGAAGGIEMLLGLKALSDQLALPTVGCNNPETGAEGMVSSVSVPIDSSYLLSTNSGFGGINAALVLKRGSKL